MPFGKISIKSRSLYVGELFSLSFFDAFLLNVEPKNKVVWYCFNGLGLGFYLSNRILGPFLLVEVGGYS